MTADHITNTDLSALLSKAVQDAYPDKIRTDDGLLAELRRQHQLGNTSNVQLLLSRLDSNLRDLTAMLTSAAHGSCGSFAYPEQALAWALQALNDALMTPAPDGIEDRAHIEPRLQWDEGDLIDSNTAEWRATADSCRAGRVEYSYRINADMQRFVRAGSDIAPIRCVCNGYYIGSAATQAEAVQVCERHFARRVW